MLAEQPDIQSLADLVEWRSEWDVLYGEQVQQPQTQLAGLPPNAALQHIMGAQQQMPGGQQQMPGGSLQQQQPGGEGGVVDESRATHTAEEGGCDVQPVLLEVNYSPDFGKMLDDRPSFVDDAFAHLFLGEGGGEGDDELWQHVPV